MPKISHTARRRQKSKSEQQALERPEYWSRFLFDRRYLWSHWTLVMIPFIITGYIACTFSLGAYLFKTGWSTSEIEWSETVKVSSCHLGQDGLWLYTNSYYWCGTRTVEGDDYNRMYSLRDISGQTVRANKTYGLKSGSKNFSVLVPDDHPVKDHWIARNWTVAEGVYAFSSLGFIWFILAILAGIFDTTVLPGTRPPDNKDAGLLYSREPT